MIRFGIIGTNWITERFILAAREADGFELTAVYSRSQETADAFAAKHDIAHTFTDLDKMASSSELDAVYIASPNSLHAAHAVLCMSHGKHVLCEKPAASNTRELQLMIDAAAEHQVVFMEAMKSTLLPSFQSVMENLPAIGKVRRYFASYCQYSSRYDAYKAGQVLNAFNPAYSNGALMDLGVYCIYPLVVLFGQPIAMKANGWLLDSGVDGQGSLIAQYPDMEAVIMYSKISNSAIPSEIQGEDGSIIIDSISDPQKIEIRYRDGRVEDISRPADRPTMYYETQVFIDMIRTAKKESPINSHANSLIVMGILDEARKQQKLVYPADTITNHLQ
ncbi:putative oxidoreductase YulF [Paenibacillus baekrokdamisoli]|uniref:Putative oxidoreductase YulF n=1 Tax=Paenibacillus baekrokdamisoli TaxID=1712516 RepID=A0A3G9IPM0_9BACL|nr:Gfo/Idh/MocA family oxidoreductase [Paenibacillus baekrokdamisoli]MBB3072003.1 putative dehydrogenase [Paenibacillus baekrokdamisoli]BBH20306.1 putative oxidoreductase YulF [Paenibacillus baekrokdamisoli]